MSKWARSALQFLAGELKTIFCKNILRVLIELKRLKCWNLCCLQPSSLGTFITCKALFRIGSLIWQKRIFGVAPHCRTFNRQLLAIPLLPQTPLKIHPRSWHPHKVWRVIDGSSSLTKRKCPRFAATSYFPGKIENLSALQRIAHF